MTNDPPLAERMIRRRRSGRRSPRRRCYNPYEPEASLELLKRTDSIHLALDVGCSTLGVH